MGCTSATGKGLGSADKKNKGSEHLTIGANKLIGPRIVYAKTHTLDGSGDLTIILPELNGVSGDYVVMATDASVAGATACAASITITTGATTVVLKGTASQGVHVVIVKAGLAV